MAVQEAPDTLGSGGSLSFKRVFCDNERASLSRTTRLGSFARNARSLACGAHVARRRRSVGPFQSHPGTPW
jgi:hypothetical protein